MTRPILATVALLALGTLALAPAAASDDPLTLQYYLPEGVEYDDSIPTPASVLGHEVGEWHVRHDLIVRYFEVLAEKSDRFHLEDYGRSHEGRRLLLATVTPNATSERVAALRDRHLKVATNGGALKDDDKVVVWMGYGVHGNESSASNASVLLAYHLAAAQGDAIDRLFDECVVLIDPSINPDGHSRFAHWANVHKSRRLVGDPATREHNEVWPGGRTNHYWFDLNRDWLLLTHPESQGRIAQFQAWKPNILTDYHEMGTNSTYFFQPGIESRQNPLTPARNLELTREIAKYHGRALDALGSLYYTEESFDDFYYGKGSTYPDVQGSIGILFEQASSRGHLQESVNGPVSFPFTIRNQFVTSLSTLEAAQGLRKPLLTYQRDFHAAALEAGRKGSERAYVFGQGEDRARNRRLIAILNAHGIRVHRLASRIRKNGHEFEPESSYVVSLAQPQYWLIRACFETRTEFPDESFYDVSTWTLPLSFGVPFAPLGSSEFSDRLIGRAVGESAEVPRAKIDDQAVAIAFEWHEYFAPRALARLQDADFSARVATRKFRAVTDAGEHDFDYGTIVLPLGPIRDRHDDVATLLGQLAQDDGVKVHVLRGGLTPTGIDLGSPSLRVLDAPKPLLVVGSGVSAYESGEVWHLLDTRYDVTLSKVEMDRLSRLDLSRYTHVIMVGGRYGDISESATESLQRWIRGGGVLIATKSAVDWAARHALGRKADADHDHDTDHDDEHGAEEEAPDPTIPAYADYESERAKGLLNGSIFQVALDTTHPIAYGYVRDRLPVFRNSTRVMPVEENPFASPIRYTEEPLLSGYASEKNVDRIASSAAVNVNRLGRGTVIRMVDNPNFRGVWWGTNKLFANALFFGGVIKNTAPLHEAAEDTLDGCGHEHTGDAAELELDQSGSSGGGQ